MTEQPADLTDNGYELTATRRGLIKTFGRMVEHEGRLNDLPMRPDNFRPMIGTYAQISAEAVRRNAIQTRGGFLDYLYAPEPRFASMETENERVAVDELLASLDFVPSLDAEK